MQQSRVQGLDHARKQAVIGVQENEIVATRFQNSTVPRGADSRVGLMNTANALCVLEQNRLRIIC